VDVARWRIELLGELRATRGAWTVTRFRTQKTAALLAFLALRRGQARPREELVELLWPDAGPESGRNSLSQALSALRQQLEPPGVEAGSVLVTTRASVALAAEATETDADELEAALEAARRATGGARAAALQRALELHGDGLLPGHYQDWALQERERLRGRAVQAARDLAHERAAAGDRASAVDALRRAVALDPLAEEAHRELMRLHDAAGEPLAALRHFEELTRVLERELGEPPSAETRELARAIERRREPGASPRAAASPARSDAPPRAAASAARPDASPRAAASAARPDAPPRAADATARGDAARPDASRAAASATSTPEPTPRLPLDLTRLFGREAELAAIADLLGPGTARLVTITGPGGIGKTRLAIEAAAQVRGRATTFVPLADLAEGRFLAGAIARALGAPPSNADLLEQVVAGLSRAPSLLVLDNFEQLVDEGAGVVRALLERAPSLLCLVTSRRRLGLAGRAGGHGRPAPAAGRGL
jgi:DNA-binding SARP family transcriptional activator